MDNIFESFLSFHTAAFVVGCYALTWLTRRGVETGVPTLKPVLKGGLEVYLGAASRWWNSFILYLIPPVWGLLLGALLFSYLTWPQGFDSRQAVMFYGMVCGWLSGLIYKFLIKLLLKKLGVKEGERDVDPKVIGDKKKD